MPENAPLDAQDIALLTEVQRDARLSTAELAQRCALSTSSCWRRLKSLEARGVIRAWQARLDPAACGLTFHALVHVQLDRHERGNLEAFIAAIGDRPEVMDCFATTGTEDYHLRVLCRDIDAFNRFLEDFLFRIPGVASARTNVILRDLKRENALPL